MFFWMMLTVAYLSAGWSGAADGPAGTSLAGTSGAGRFAACTDGAAACGEADRDPNRYHLPCWPPSASLPGPRPLAAGRLPSVLAV